MPAKRSQRRKLQARKVGDGDTANVDVRSSAIHR